jgi:hypothetical protein
MFSIVVVQLEFIDIDYLFIHRQAKKKNKKKVKLVCPTQIPETKFIIFIRNIYLYCRRTPEEFLATTKKSG